jgi:hypothetical protein
MVEDAYGNVVTFEAKPLPRPAQQELDRIAFCLRMPRRTTFPQCKFKSRYQAYLLDRKLGFTKDEVIKEKKGVHSQKGHVCAECRCKKVAGWGTRGWWYWGPQDGPEVGHYGVGPCFHHTKHRARYGLPDIHYARQVMREIEQMQQQGIAPNAAGEFLIELKEAEEALVLRKDLRNVVDEAREQGAKLKAMIEGKEGQLTMRTPKGEIVEADDVTAFRLMNETLKTISSLAKNELDAESWKYFHGDDVSLMVNEIMRTAETLILPRLDQQTWLEFGGAVKDALCKLRPRGKNERA